MKNPQVMEMLLKKLKKLMEKLLKIWMVPNESEFLQTFEHILDFNKSNYPLSILFLKYGGSIILNVL
jgi:hypothetical protein